MKNLYTFLAKSGGGKDTVVDILIKEYFPDAIKLISKCDREERYPGEPTHEFVTREQLIADRAAGQVVAYNHYNSHDYWATRDQVDRSDMYVIDKPGVIQLKREYHSKPIKVIAFGVSAETSMMRMLKRGDSAESVAARLAVDDAAFANLAEIADLYISVDNLTPEETAEMVAIFIKAEENRLQPERV